MILKHDFVVNHLTNGITPNSKSPFRGCTSWRRKLICSSKPLRIFFIKKYHRGEKKERRRQTGKSNGILRDNHLRWDLKVTQVRCISIPAWWYNVRTTMRARKEKLEKAGPLPPKPRFIWPNWNYKAELFAFGKRLNEDMSETTLLRAFTHSSYLQEEETKQKELRNTITPLSSQDNSVLILEGEKLMSDFIYKYLCLAYPSLPEQGIRVVQQYLLDENLVAYVASNLGFADLILSSDFPVTKPTLASTFKAFIGAIKLDGSVHRAEVFVQDFIIPQLVSKDILEIWEISNPTSYLRNLLQASGKEPETRLLRETGRNSIFAVYLVGIYVDRQLLGQGPGETLNTAEEMASLDALKKIFGLKEYDQPLPFGLEAEKLKQSGMLQKSAKL